MDEETAKIVCKEHIADYLMNEYGIKDTRKFSCSMLNPNHPDRHPSAYLGKDYRVHCAKGCYGRGADIFDLMQMDTGLYGSDLFKYAYDYFGILPDDPAHSEKPIITMKEAKIIGVTLPHMLMMPDGRRKKCSWQDFLSREQFYSLLKEKCSSYLKRMDIRKASRLEDMKETFFSLEREYPDFNPEYLLKIAEESNPFPEEEYRLIKKLYARILQESHA